MDDIIQSIKAYLYDRAASPLAGAFLFATIILNHRVLFILFSGNHYEENFDAIDKVLLVELIANSPLTNLWLGRIIHLLVLPGLLAGLYLWLYPKLAEPFYRYSLSKAQDLRSIKQVIQDERLLTEKESRDLYRRVSELVTNYDTLEQEKNREIEALRQLLADSEADTEVALDLDGWHGDEADPAEYDGHIDNQIKFLPHGRFILEDLFPNDVWSLLSKGNKVTLGKRLKERVERGDFVDVIALGRNAGNIQMYEKFDLDRSGSQK